MKVKVVYNSCYGGFGLSKLALERLAQLGVAEAQVALDREPSVMGSYYLDRDLPRHDPRLVQVVEELGEKACGPFADLQVATLSGNRYIIDEYDGNESVQEPDDINWIIVE